MDLPISRTDAKFQKDELCIIGRFGINNFTNLKTNFVIPCCSKVYRIKPNSPRIENCQGIPEMRVSMYILKNVGNQTVAIVLYLFLLWKSNTVNWLNSNILQNIFFLVQ